jgi:hypothetical protein
LGAGTATEDGALCRAGREDPLLVVGLASAEPRCDRGVPPGLEAGSLASTGLMKGEKVWDDDDDDDHHHHDHDDHEGGEMMRKKKTMMMILSMRRRMTTLLTHLAWLGDGGVRPPVLARRCVMLAWAEAVWPAASTR